MESWKQIPGYEGLYEASSEGRVRRAVSTALCHRKLTAANVSRAIELVSGGLSRIAVSKIFGVSATVINRIVSRGAYRPFTPKALRPGRRRDGYLFVALSKNGVVREPTVHSLVLSAFVGPRAEGQQVNHLDGDKTNNRLENLEYTTRSGNMLHSVDILGHSHKITLADACAIRSDKSSRKEIAERYGISIALVAKIRNNDVWLR